MPSCHEVQRHCADVFDSERQYCQKRVQREEFRAHRAVDDGASKVAAAAAEAQRVTRDAIANAEAAVSVAEARLRQDRERQAKELAQAEQRLEEAFRHTHAKVRAAEHARDAARPVIAERVEWAEKAQADAVKAAEKTAQEAEEMCQKRISEAKGREKAAEIRVHRLSKEATERMEQRARDSARAMAQIQQDAEERHRQLERVTAERVDKCLDSLRAWLLRVEREWAATQSRVSDELQRAHRLTEAERANVEDVVCRGQASSRDVEDTLVHSRRVAEEVVRSHADRCRKELHFTAEELEAIEGLEDIAHRLRNGKLWRDMAVDELTQ